MNLREGRSGAQEGAAAAGIAMGISAVFVTDGAALYGRGNAAYLAALISAALAFVVFLLACRAMRRQGCETLLDLLCHAFGGVLGRVLAVLLSGVLVMASAGVFSRFLLMLNRFVFVETVPWLILCYLVPVAAFLCLLGLEILCRTARLFCWLTLAALLGALLLGVSHYALYRLAPFPLDAGLLLGLGARGMFGFFPALIALLVAGRGLHGVRNAERAGIAATLFGGGVAMLSRFCLGMTYGYQELSAMHSPMYRLTMTARSGGYFPRLDKLLLFGWTLAAILAAGFYQYAAALLWCQAFEERDIRPAGLLMSGLCAALCLLAERDIPWLAAAGDFLSGYGWLIAALPVAIAALIGLWRKPAQHAGQGEMQA